MAFRINFLVVLLIVTSSCTGHRIKHFLRSSDLGVGDSVIVDIGSVIQQTFDCYYYSGGIAFRSDISKLIGIEYKGCDIGDDHYAVFFLKDNQLVYEERFNIRELDCFRGIQWGEAVSSPNVLFKKIPNSSFWWYKVDQVQEE